MKSHVCIMIISGLLMICTLKGNAAEFIISHDRPDSAAMLKQDSCSNFGGSKFQPDPKYREKIRLEHPELQYSINTTINQQNTSERQNKIIQKSIIPENKKDQKGFYLVDRNVLHIHLENINPDTTLLHIELAGHLTINLIF